MTVTDVATSIDELSKRMRALEMSISNASTFYDPNPVFDTVTVGGTTDPVTVIAPVSAPTDVTATPGSFFDAIYVGVSWTPPVSGHANGYYIELAEKTGPTTYVLERSTTVYGTSTSFDGLKPYTDYGVRVEGVNKVGRFTTGAAWVDFTTGLDSTIPPAVTGLVVVRGATSLTAKWNPLTDADVAGGKGLYIVQIDTVNTFNSGNLRSSTNTDWVRAFSDISTESSWWTRVAPIDSSGNQGPWTTTGTTTAAGGVNDSMIIADLSAAKITFGSMSGDRITANTAAISILKTSSLTAADITLAGGSFIAGSPPTTGMLMNSQGIRLYAAGVATVTLDATTGSATFTGTVSGSTVTGSSIVGGTITGVTITGVTLQTATSGARIVMNTSTVNTMNFYSGDAGEVAPGAVLGEFAGGFPRIRMISPTYSGFTDPSQIFMAPTILDMSGTRTGAGGSIFMRADTVAFKVRFGAGSDFLIQDATNSDATLLAVTRTGEGFGQLTTRDVFVSNLTATATVGDASSGRITCDSLVVATFSPASISTGSASIESGTITSGVESGHGYWKMSSQTIMKGLNSSTTIQCRNGSDSAYGDVRCATLTATTKPFQIDHPVLGSSHLLQHNAIEGPAVEVMYRGRVTLDSGGAGRINVDEVAGMTAGTFEALTLDGSRQIFLFSEGGLTSTASWEGVDAIVSGTPGDVVGWLIMAERDDLEIKGTSVTDDDGRLVVERARTMQEMHDELLPWVELPLTV